MEKKMENEMETREYIGLYSGLFYLGERRQSRHIFRKTSPIDLRPCLCAGPCS